VAGRRLEPSTRAGSSLSRLARAGASGPAPDRRQAMSRSGCDRSRPSGPGPTERAAVRMGEVQIERPLIVSDVGPEDVLGACAPPGAQAACSVTEHVFARVRPEVDGTGVKPATFVAPSSAGPGGAAQCAGPRVDHTASLVCIRSTTPSVKAVVPAPPPRSGVLTPAATVSSAAS
jgi:hypothetical protein